MTMKLVNAVLRPGKVIRVLEAGNILAEVPGLFSSQDIDLLPPIEPFFHGAENAFSKPKEYQDVWVLNMEDNPQQLYWIRKDKLVEKNGELLNEENVEILCNRESGIGWATIYFSDGSGWVIKKDESIIQIRQDGSIVMKVDWPHRAIEIAESSINIGTEGKAAHPAAYGDKIEDILTDLCMLLKSMQLVANTNPYTVMLSKVMKPQIKSIQEKIGTISSQHVRID